jgi:hypothetical protein
MLVGFSQGMSSEIQDDHSSFGTVLPFLYLMIKETFSCHTSHE